MTEIPADPADARDAWRALPEAVRRDALKRAAKAEAADDPFVAAIIAGVLRPRPSARSWLRRMAGALPWTAGVGFLAALQYFGILGIRTAVTGAGLVIVAIVLVIVAGWAAVDFVMRRTRREPPENLSAAAIPAYAELPNLRKVLDASPTRLPEPLVVRGHPRVRGALFAAALAGVMTLAFIRLLDEIQSRPGDYHRLLHVHVTLAAGAAAIAATWFRHLNRLPLRIDESGLRFGFQRAVPWSDVLGVEWSGPSAAFPDEKPALFWRLRDQPDVRIDLDAVQVPPERIVLAAEAYKGGRGILLR